jgi:hypothetical protein
LEDIIKRQKIKDKKQKYKDKRRKEKEERRKLRSEVTKSINHKGAQALRNSPVGYFSAVA